jgi:hypothetical protein
MTMVRLREALAASWDARTSYEGLVEEGNPAYAQCYATSRVVQRYFPAAEIAEGNVWTGNSVERHFWNVLVIDGVEYHIDLTWQQFPHGSVVQSYWVWPREELTDRPGTVERCNLLHKRVAALLAAPRVVRFHDHGPLPLSWTPDGSRCRQAVSAARN